MSSKFHSQLTAEHWLIKEEYKARISESFIEPCEQVLESHQQKS